MLNCPTFAVVFAWKFSRHFPGQVHGGDGLQYTSQMVAVQEVVDKSEERRVAGQVARLPLDLSPNFFGNEEWRANWLRLGSTIFHVLPSPYKNFVHLCITFHRDLELFKGFLFLFPFCFFSHVFHGFSIPCRFATQDWVSISVGGANSVSVAPLPEPLMELQRRSSCLRQRIVGANGREVGAAVLGCQRGQEASSLKDSRTTEYNGCFKEIYKKNCVVSVGRPFGAEMLALVGLVLFYPEVAEVEMPRFCQEAREALQMALATPPRTAALRGK